METPHHSPASHLPCIRRHLIYTSSSARLSVIGTRVTCRQILFDEAKRPAEVQLDVFTIPLCFRLLCTLEASERLCLGCSAAAPTSRRRCTDCALQRGQDLLPHLGGWCVPVSPGLATRCPDPASPSPGWASRMLWVVLIGVVAGGRPRAPCPQGLGPSCTRTGLGANPPALPGPRLVDQISGLHLRLCKAGGPRL